MSSGGQIVGGIVGAVVGYVATGFNPVGAFQGAAIGMAVGGALDPPKGPTVEGPRLQDKGVQTSTYGVPMSRVYGTIGGSGNITQIENNRLKETVRKEKQGGKGGGSTTTTKIYTYSATFQLSLCEGPIAGVRRIWCSDKLIYNAGSDDLETIIASNQAASGFRIYLGTDDQMPDPRYEAEYGVGNVSAHRGEAYIAFYDFPLADYSNTLQAAQFKVEVITSGSASTPEMFSVITITPDASAFFQPGSAGGSEFPAYFGDWLGSGNQQYIMNSSGAMKPVLFATGSSANDYYPAIMTSADTARQVWISVLDGTESLLILEGSSWNSYVTVNDLSNFHVVERSGNYWFQWNNDANNPGLPSSGFIWCANFTVQDSFSGTSLAQGIKSSIPQGSINAATSDGRLVSAFMPEIDSESTGSVSIDIFDSDMAIVSSGNITIPAREGDINGDESVGYVDDRNIFHIISPLYMGTGTPSYLFGKYYYTVVDLSDISIVSTSTLFVSALDDTVYTPYLVRVEDGVLYLSGSTVTKSWRAAFAVGVISIAQIPLSLIIEEETSLSSLLVTADVDVSELSSTVRGYRVSGGSLRSAIEPLQAAFPFDVRQHGYQIQFVPRGQSSIVTIPWEELGATEGDRSTDIIQQSREMDSQLPARTTIKYLDASREYAIAEQYSERLNTEAINRVDRQLPLVLSANEAAGVSEVLNFLPWLERTDAAFTLPPTYSYLEPGDVVTIETQDAIYELRLTEINDTPSGLLEVKAKANRAALYASTATGSEGVPPTGIIGLSGPSLFVPLDIPVVDETIQDDPGFVGVMTGITTGWPGALAVRSNDGGQTWADLQAYNTKATIGAARGTLSVSTGTMIDQSTLAVDMVSGTLESITKDQMLSGINYAAYGLDGRWEIVRFQNATLQGDGSYLVSHFVRGDRGTEWATGLHVAGDYFVLLDDPDNAFIGSPVESIALERLYRGVTSGASIDSSSDVSFTYQGVNLECLSPVYARGTRDGSSNFTGTFTRRSRLSSSWWTTGTEAPIGETTQSYEIDVMNGPTVERTITAVTPTFSYSAADQTTDFGSPQSSITFRIYQLSGTVGRGYPYEVTL